MLLWLDYKPNVTSACDALGISWMFGSVPGYSMGDPNLQSWPCVFLFSSESFSLSLHGSAMLIL